MFSRARTVILAAGSDFLIVFEPPVTDWSAVLDHGECVSAVCVVRYNHLASQNGLTLGSCSRRLLGSLE